MWIFLTADMGQSLEQFRKQVIRSSLFPETSLGKALARMGFVQADPIRCPARAQDLILRQRVKHYKSGDLERQYPRLELEEVFLYAYGIGSRDLWKLIHPHPKAEEPLNDAEKTVLAAVHRHGSMHPRELEGILGSGRKKNYWGRYSRVSKLALESLHRQGHLRIHRREKGIRVYEVATREHTSLGKRERFKAIVVAALRSMGPTSPSFLMSELRHFAYLEKSRTGRLEAIKELIRTGRVRTEQWGGNEFLSLKENKLSRIPLDRVRILAPFDPIVRDRKRFQELWGWEYRFEAYIPAAKRNLGYYAMPVLWRDAIIGWANAVVEDGKLHLDFKYADRRPSENAFFPAAEQEARKMAAFLGLAETACSI